MNRYANAGINQHSPLRRVLPVLLKGIGGGLLLSLVLLFAAALVLYYTSVPEKTAPYLVFVISLAAVVAGARYCGRQIGYRGWLYGGLVGLIYVLIVLGAGLLLVDSIRIGWHFLTKISLGFVFGAVGGMWGVND